MPSGVIVVFDLGGVVVRICRSWLQAARLAGLPEHPRVMEADMLEARKAIVKRYEVSALTDEEYFAAMSSAMQGLYSPDDCRHIHDIWITGEYPGIARLITDLHAQSIATGVLSNTNAWHWRQMTSGPHGAAKFPTPAMVQHLHASHLLRLVKPDPAIWQAFQATTGFDASSIIYFDDLPENVTAANAAGWDALPIDHDADTAAQIRLHLRARGLNL
jgi:putative hydrolase of the HAD superfamily